MSKWIVEITNWKTMEDIALWCDKNVGTMLRFNVFEPYYYGRDWSVTTVGKISNEKVYSSVRLNIEIKNEKLATMAMLRWSA